MGKRKRRHCFCLIFESKSHCLIMILDAFCFCTVSIKSRWSLVGFRYWEKKSYNLSVFFSANSRHLSSVELSILIRTISNLNFSCENEVEGFSDVWYIQFVQNCRWSPTTELFDTVRQNIRANVRYSHTLCPILKQIEKHSIFLKHQSFYYFFDTLAWDLSD